MCVNNRNGFSYAAGNMLPSPIHIVKGAVSPSDEVQDSAAPSPLWVSRLALSVDLSAVLC